MVRPLSKAQALNLDGSDFPEAIRPRVQKLLGQPGGLRALAELLHQSADTTPTIELAHAAIVLRAAAPLDRYVWAATDDLVYSQVPKWHWRMLQDQDRARTYRRAIEKAVQPEMLVLEIGAGTGLLAMMAAQAGAEHVFTVEANPLMAEIALSCIERNGFSNKVTVLGKHSTDLQIGVDLPRRADLLIHEILSGSVLTEGLAPTIHHALYKLLTPHAPLLPELIGIEGVLSGDVTATDQPWWDVEGFDLTPLAHLDAAAHGVPGSQKRLRLSEPVSIAQVDLREPDLMQPRSYTGTLTASQDGIVSGLEQWMKVCFPGDIMLSSDNSASHWGTCYHPFAARKEVAKGDEVPVEVTLDARNLAVGLAQDVDHEAFGWSPGL